MASIKQPRASIACSRNRDPDYLLLASEGIEGLAAVALFDALLCAAKDQDNGGVFSVPPIVVAALTGVEIKTYSKLIQRLIKVGWVVESEGAVSVRSYAKWNPQDQRGGRRIGAGRPSVTGNQNGIKAESNDIQSWSPPSPSPSPVTDLTTLPAAQARSASDGRPMEAARRTAKPRKRGVSGDDVAIPDNLTPYATDVRRWFDYRLTRKPPIYDVSVDAALAEMAKLGPNLPAAIDQSIAAGWQGLFAPKGGPAQRHPSSRHFAAAAEDAHLYKDL